MWPSARSATIRWESVSGLTWTALSTLACTARATAVKASNAGGLTGLGFEGSILVLRFGQELTDLVKDGSGHLALPRPRNVPAPPGGGEHRHRIVGSVKADP